jgi:hypothetical protein
MTRQVHDFKPRNVVALLHRAGDLDRATVPLPEQHWIYEPGGRELELGRVRVAHSSITLCVGHFCGVAVDGRVDVWCGATVIEVRVAQHNPIDPTEALGRAQYLLRHGFDAAVEERDTPIGDDRSTRS